MAGKGKALLSGSRSGPLWKEGHTSRSTRAGLKFPVRRIERALKAGKHAECVSAGAPVYLAAVLQYLASEVLELAGHAAMDNKKHRITPHHIQLAVTADQDLSELFNKAIIPSSGAAPHIDDFLGPESSESSSSHPHPHHHHHHHHRHHDDDNLD